MKILYLSIIVIGIGSIGIFLLVIPHLQYSSVITPQMTINSNDSALDFSNAIPDNPLGIEAKVVYEVDTSILCPTKCVIPPTPHLILSSQNGTWFVSYEVCDGMSCKKDKINSPYVHLNNIPKDIMSKNIAGVVAKEMSHINLQDLSWKVGDSVHIKVKASPAELTINGQIITHPEKTMTVDLGESKIMNATKTAL